MIKQQLARLVRNDEGQDLIEYALIAGLIALATVGVVGTLGTGLTGLYNSLVGALNQIVVGGGAGGA